MADPLIPQGRFRRVLPVAGLTAQTAGARLIAGWREWAGDTDALEEFRAATATRYSELFGRSKGVLMKAGQLYGMLDFALVGGDSLLPYQQELQRLQTHAPVMPAALVLDIIGADLRRPAGQVFAEFNEQPMAAASIGQVHEATLVDGRRVAVKVQYPGAAEAIRADLLNLQLLETFWRYTLGGIGVPMLDMRRAVRELAARIGEEVDYRREAAHIAVFGSLYRNHPFIRVPEVITEASGDRVLTLTLMDGMDWAQAQQHSDQDLKNSWAETVFRFLFGSYRHANLMYGDPHPDNCRFRSDGTVAFLDFGCVQVLPERDRWSLVAISRAVIEDRAADFYRMLPDLGFIERDTDLCTDPALWEWTRSAHSYLVGPQPFTYSRESTLSAIGTFINPDRSVLRRLSLPGPCAVGARLAAALVAIPVALGATIQARSDRRLGWRRGTDHRDGNATRGVGTRARTALRDGSPHSLSRVTD